MLKFIKNKVWLILLLVILVPTIFRLFQPGFFPMQDDLQAFRIYEMDKCVVDGQLPCRWVPDAGYSYGYPQFIYYPPFVYYLGEVFHLVGFQFIDAVKIMFILGYILSAVTMYFLVESFLGAFPALFAGLMYSYIPYKAVEVYVRGAMSEFWALVFFPLIFLFIYKLVISEKLKYIILLAITLGLLFTTHNLMTLIFAPVAIVWAIYWVVAEKKWRALIKLGIAGLLGFGLAAFFELPVLLEKQYVHLESMLTGYFDYRAHFVNIKRLFLSLEWGYGSSGFPNEKLNLSTGIPQWIMGIVAAVVAIIRFKKEKKIAVLTLVLVFVELAVLFMIHSKSSFIWAMLPPLWYMQFPWRFLAVSIFLLPVIGALGIYLIGKWGKVVALAFSLGAIALYISFFVPKAWISNMTDAQKFSGDSWNKQLTISIFDYLPIYAKLPPPSAAPEKPEILEGKGTFTSYEKRSNSQNGEIVVKNEVLVRAPIFDFPGMQVKIDNQLVKHWNNDCRSQKYCLGLVTFKVPEGNHKIEIKLTNTPVRLVGEVVSLVSVLVLLVLIFWKKNEKNTK